MGADHSDGIGRARDAARQAYAPYSHFHVGCVAESADGERFEGVNMENASYGVGMCAEVGALTAATRAGRLGEIRRVYVAGGRISAAGELEGSEVVTPCGRCRQLIAESAAISGLDIEVVCASGDGTHSIARSISSLLPASFGAAALDSDGRVEAA
jgi:cytidine deaminase